MIRRAVSSPDAAGRALDRGVTMKDPASGGSASMPHRICRVGHAALLSSLIALLLATSGAVHAADPTDKDWPCQQRKVPEISGGMVWTGPSLDDVGDTWRADDSVAELAHKIAARRTDLADAKSMIAQFAAGVGADKNRKLTALMAGALSIVNSDRSAIIAGIERYTRRQRDLAAKVERQSAELDALPANGTAEQNARRQDLQERQTWDARILQERERSLTYVCETPVLLEQRIFALGREIASHLAQ
jgi:hypothetical protein